MNELSINYDPWSYLGNADFYAIGAEYGYMFSSLYVALQTIGIFGCVITIVIAFARFASSSPMKRAEAKDIITKKFLILIAIFAGAWLFGVILSTILRL